MNPSGQPELARNPRAHVARVWRTHLRKPTGFPTDSALSVQLPVGEYQLSEQDDIRYQLYASEEFALTLRVTELERLRDAGDLVIDGVWP